MSSMALKAFPVQPTIWGEVIENADMLISTGVVFSGTTNQRWLRHVRGGLYRALGLDGYRVLDT